MAKQVTCFDSVETLKSRTKATDLGCLEWAGSLFWDGYGQYNSKKNGKWIKERAHRASYRLYKGDPTGFLVCHSCDNPKCVNPDHLFLGTPLDNIRDMDKKGRRARVGAKGESHPNSKITESTARFILNKKGRHCDVARAFGVSQAIVSNIKRRKTWRHI